uniref:Putative Peptide methionine sulfoxide reductase msrA n=1 Tax=Davidia involucrata TaxID=16924 RepID=A0A5B7AB94_DAVIN
MLSNGGGRFYWVRNDSTQKVQGIVVIFAWVSIHESHLKNYVNLYSSLGWNSLVCLADFLNPILPERATSLAFVVLSELVEELRIRPCPLVLAAFSGGSKACMYKFFQIIEGACEAQLNLDDSKLVRNCISGHIYDSSPVDFTSDLVAQFTLHPTILRMPGSAKLVSLVAKGVTSGLDALFLTRFGSQRSEYWQTLYSSVSLGGPFLILCSENDDRAPYPIICNFAQSLQDLGGSVKLVKWNGSPHVGHYKHYPIQYRAAVAELLEQAVSVHSQRIQRLRERIGMEGHDEISELICDLQKAAVNSNESFRRVARGPNDHFFLPSSAECNNGGDSGSLQDEQKERSVHLANHPSISAHSVLGQILFDACVPKNVEGWDIRFSGSLNGQPFASARKHSPLNAIKRIRRSRL